MELFTKGIETKLQKQYPKGSDLKQKVVVKIFDPIGNWTWYLMNQDPSNPDYLWGIVKGIATEMGSVSKAELESHVGPLGLKLERDLYFTSRPALEIWEALDKGEHV
jgi:hypothetical protein